MSKALSVIVDNSNRMIAAVLEINGEIIVASKNKLSYYRDTIGDLENAVINYNGIVRAKRGSLPRITKEEFQKQYKVAQNVDNIDFLLHLPKF